MAKPSFNVLVREIKRVKEIPTNVFTLKQEKITEASLKKVIKENLEKNVLCFVVENTVSGVKTEYKKQPKAKNYTIKTLKK